MEENKNTDLNSKSYWNDRFFEAGSWEKNNGRNQTRTFAERFNRVIDIPLKRFKLLDVGCALGDALPVFSKKYPDAKLSGCDFSDISIERCKKEHGDLASFFTSSIENVSGQWDIIYCSNVLEHFANPVELAEMMLHSCRILYLMVPYKELNNDMPLTPDTVNLSGHMYSFYKNSFNILIKNGQAANISSVIDDCPVAWGWKFKKKLLHVLSTVRHMRNLKNIFKFPKEIIFEIYSK